MRGAHIYRLSVALVIATSLAVAWRANFVRQKMEESTTMMARQQVSTESRLRASELQLQTASKSVTKKRPADLGPARATIDGERALAEMIKMRALHNDPQWQRLKLNAVQAGLFLEYALFYHAQGLSPAQISALEAKITEHRTQLLDIGDAAQAQGLLDSDPALVTLRAREKEQFTTAATNILGAEGTRALEEFDNSAEERGLGNRLMAALAVSPEPLSAEKYARVVLLLRNLKIPGPVDPSERVIDWPQVQASAAGFLSAPQLAEFNSAATLTQRGEQIGELIAHYRQWAKDNNVADK